MTTLSRVQTKANKEAQKKAEAKAKNKKIVTGAVIGTVGVASLAGFLASRSPITQVEASTITPSKAASSATVSTKPIVQPMTNQCVQPIQTVKPVVNTHKTVVATPVVSKTVSKTWEEKMAVTTIARPVIKTVNIESEKVTAQKTNDNTVNTSATSVQEETNNGSSAAVSMVVNELKSKGMPTGSGEHIVFDHKQNGYYIIQYFTIVDDGGVPHTSTNGWYAVNLENKKVYDITLDTSILNKPVTTIQQVVSKPVTAVAQSVTKPAKQVTTSSKSIAEQTKEMMGQVIKVKGNSVVLEIEGENYTFISDGSRYVNNQFSQLEYGNSIVVRYVDGQNGTNIVKDSFVVYSHTKGELGQYITATYSGMADNHSVEVYVNHKPQTFQLSPALFGQDFDKKFAPGTKVCVAVVKTAGGLIVENIDEL